MALQRDQLSREDFVALAVEEETLDLWGLGGFSLLQVLQDLDQDQVLSQALRNNSNYIEKKQLSEYLF